MRRLIILAAAIVAALAAAAIPASAATTAPAAPADGIIQDIYTVFWFANEGLSWFRNVNNVYVINGQGGAQDFAVDGGAWSEIHNRQDGNKCVTWNGGPNQIYDVSCRSAPSQLWASVRVGGIGSTVYMLWNQYVKDTNPRECGNTLAPVITADGGNGDLYLSCPQGGPTTYTVDQQWDFQP